MQDALNFSSLMDVTKKKNRFNNILAMKISVVSEFNGTNSSSTDTNLDTFRFCQKI